MSCADGIAGQQSEDDSSGDSDTRRPSHPSVDSEISSARRPLSRPSHLTGATDGNPLTLNSPCDWPYGETTPSTRRTG